MNTSQLHLIVGPAALRERWLRGGRRVWSHPAWDQVAAPDWAATIMTEDVTDRFHAKQGRSIARWDLNSPGGRLIVYLKRHFVLPRRHGLLATLFPRAVWSPGGQEWHNLAWAAEAGVPVPRALAAGEFVGPSGKLQSFLAVEELAGMLPLHEAIPMASVRLDSAAFRRWKLGLAIEMARLTRLLHDRQRFHKDLYLCHFYIPESATARPPIDWRGIVHMIDFHRLAHHPLTATWWQVKDLAELLYSSDVAGVDERDRLAFWRAYRPTRWSRWRVRGLAAAVRLKWRRYRDHNRKRKVLAAKPAA